MTHLDRENPWPGLASFTEDARGFFFGRERETDELSRLVRRQTLTVLFGQSGLGKSSLLHAGLFPLLRDTDHLPLYLRLDHAPSTPPLAEQVKAALTAAFAAAKADAPAFRADETLWEYFHRKDVDIWSAKNRLLTPVLAFDQFEEVFTLGRADEAARERSRVFLAELACLVENRAPAAVQAKLDSGELDPARFNFAKPSCSVILSLREDFLPDLEGLKQAMPALVHNRLRLKKLSGTQALEIVTRPAPHLLAEGVAEKIVEFVAGARGGSAERLAELDVEPPLLSVICRELNDRRRALGQEKITADLVSGNRREILTDFYERSVADLPEAMRTFVEDRLLTKSGFRDNLALETALEFPGVTRPLIDTLVTRRLLRLEDRLGVQRVELTHDVLAEVIRGSRDSRLQRAALAESARRSRRQRGVITGLAAAVVILCVGAVFGVRAQRRAEQAARAEAARSSRTDLSYGSQLLEQGKVSEGIAYLARAAKTDPTNYAAGPRLMSALAYRAFALPVGLNLPHGAETWVVGTSGDGSRLLTLAGDTEFSIWDPASGQRVGAATKLGSSLADRTATALSPGGDRFALSCVDGTINIWETATGKRLAGPLQSGPSTIRLAFSPDGRWLAAGNSEATAKIWDTRSGELKATLPLAQWVSSVSFSPDSSRLLTTVYIRGWRVWSVPSGEPLTPFITEGDVQANYGAFSRDGKEVVIGDMSGALRWDWAKGEKIGPRLFHDFRCDFAEYSQDGTQLVTTSRSDRVTKVWELPSGELRRKFDFAGSSVSLSRDGRRLLTVTDDGSIRLMDVASGRAIIEPIRGAEFVNAVFSPDEREIRAGARDGIVRRFRVDVAAVAPLRISRGQVISRFGFEDGEKLLLGAADKTEIIDSSTGQVVSSKPEVSATRTGNLRSTIHSSDRGFRAGIGAGGQIEVWDLRQPDAPQRRVLNSGVDDGARLVFSSDGRRLARRSFTDSKVVVWDTQSGEQLGEPFMVPGKSASFVAFDPASERLAAGDTDGNMVVWDIASHRQLGETIRQGGQIYGIAFSPDGRRLICGGHSRLVHLMDVETGKLLFPPLRLPSSANLFFFSKDGRWVTIPTQGDNRIHVWDTQTGALRTLELGNERAVRSIDFARDSTRVVIGDFNEGTLRVWSTVTGQLETEPIRPDAIPINLWLSQTGRFVAFIARPMGMAEIWPLPTAPENTRVPEWMPRLATSIIGGAITTAGELKTVATDAKAMSALAQELAALPDDAPYVKWGRWLLADPAKRSISPETTLTAPEAGKLFTTNPVSGLVARALRLRQQGNRTEAEWIEQQILRAAPTVPAEDVNFVLTGLVLLLDQLLVDHCYHELEPLARAAIAMKARSSQPRDSSASVDLNVFLGHAHGGLGRHAEAEPYLLAAWGELAKNTSNRAKVLAAESARMLADGYEATGQPAKAAEWRRRSAGGK